MPANQQLNLNKILLDIFDFNIDSKTSPIFLRKSWFFFCINLYFHTFFYLFLHMFQCISISIFLHVFRFIYSYIIAPCTYINKVMHVLAHTHTFCKNTFCCRKPIQVYTCTLVRGLRNCINLHASNMKCECYHFVVLCMLFITMMFQWIHVIYSPHFQYYYTGTGTMGSLPRNQLSKDGGYGLPRQVANRDRTTYTPR